MPARWPDSLKRLGLHTPQDLLFHFPLRYEDESQVHPLRAVQPGMGVQVQVKVLSCQVVFRPRRMMVVEVADDSGRASLRYLYFKDAMRAMFPVGAAIRVLGEARRHLAGIEFIHPRVRSGWLSPEALQGKPLEPVYPAGEGVSQSLIRRWVGQALSQHLPQEWLPQDLLAAHGLPELPEAIRSLHAPEPGQSLTAAWNRIRLDELLAQQIALKAAKSRRGQRQALALGDERGLAQALLHRLPFSLTPAQLRVWAELAQDLARTRPSHRLIQGDVGSGKTVIAALAVAAAAGSGCQAAVMAPTEILAAQLAEKLIAWLTPLGLSVRLHTGRLSTKARREVLAGLADGSLDVVVGTQALIQPDVAFHRLGLAVIDEQHRFGVGQRIALRSERHDQSTDPDQALTPHLMGMSATPIPRSLAMTFLADLDVSTIDERPPGRLPIRTRLMASSRRDELLERLLGFLSEPAAGQAYWVCPVIEEQETAERPLRALEETEAWIRPHLGDRLAVVHGRLSADEKAAEMLRFQRGEAQLLLATTVIEVGVDVPNARLMIIDHAERFGLAQLHQLRGRVGRGAGESSCILVYEEPLGDLARQRLLALHQSQDGFELAREDLRLRGPGEILGVRQSGEPSLRFSDLSRDEPLVSLAVALGEGLTQTLLSGNVTGQTSGPSQGSLPVGPEALVALLNRWAHRAEDLLVSG